MSELKKRWQNMADRIDARSLRERTLIFIAAAAVLISLTNILLIDPLLAHHKMLSDQIVQMQLTNSIMQTQIQTLLKMSSHDPNAALKIKLAELRVQSERSGKTLGNIQSRLVSPQQMPALLEDILRQNKNVHLIALKTLPVETLNTQTDNKSAAKTNYVSKSGTHDNTYVYKHGVEITLSGSYFELVHYLSAMETLPWRMFWGNAELVVDDSHNMQLTLRLYTLSQDQAWLST
ncbi:MAG: type II secretion system protein GspM [Sulfuriferula sp.]